MPRPNMLPSPVINTAVPRFHTRIITVASSSRNSDSAVDVMAATARPPIMAPAIQDLIASQIDLVIDTTIHLSGCAQAA